MRTDHESHTLGSEGPCGSSDSSPSLLNMPCTGPQDLDLMAVESEALDAAGIPFEWRDALRRTVPASPEEGHPCPGGGGA